jgi:hypothetical protein
LPSLLLPLLLLLLPLLLLPLLLLPSLLLPPPLTMPKLMPVVLVVLVRGLALVVSPLASRYATRASINSPDEGGNPSN